MPDTANFAGLRVAAFESRRAEDMQRLIEKLGGEAHVSPSMREVPIEENPAVIEFARDIIAGRIQIVILMTGVGFRHLLGEVEQYVDRQQFLEALAKRVIVARGPKPVAALAEVGLKATHRVPEPNTWRELLVTVDANLSLTGATVGLQEYGKPNPQLVAALQDSGATVRSVQVYRWEFPEDTGPLEHNVAAIAAGQRDVALFTSAHQVVNLLRMAEDLDLMESLRREFDRLVVGSIGPTTSEMLREQELPIDLEPEHPKMGQLVAAAAERGGAILHDKRAAGNPHVTVKPWHPAEAEAARPRHPSEDGPFIRACRRQATEVTPIWLMRQAGRYMPEYRAIREKTTFLELCKNPQLCAEVMIQTVERLGVDAAIIFSDLLPILEPMGIDLEFAAGEGPVIHNPVREPRDVDRVRELEPAELDESGPLGFVMQTVSETRAGLSKQLPVIGFAGAPFTLASYVIEGGGSRNYAHTKTLMYGDEGVWGELMGRLSRSITRYLNAQIAAGAQCVQIFDSWAGCLYTEDYLRYVLPYTRQVLENLTPGVPVINFATGNPALLPMLSLAGGDVIGIDWRVRLDHAWQAVGHDRAVQGNLDPLVLLAPRDEIRRRAKEILVQAAGRDGHIFNLGHGVLPQTNPDHAIALIDAVHEFSSR